MNVGLLCNQVPWTLQVPEQPPASNIAPADTLMRGECLGLGEEAGIRAECDDRPAMVPMRGQVRRDHPTKSGKQLQRIDR